MPPKLKYWTFIGLICLGHLLMAPSASAVTADVARRCGALADKAYPLRVPGNPAAGRTNGTAQDVRAYFNKCVANGGNTGEQPPK